LEEESRQDFEGLMAGVVRKLARTLSERLASNWRLLSDTTAFLSRTSVFEHYEAQLRDLRARLQASRGDERLTGDIRKEITQLRSSLRLQGYDLSLGALELSVKGFRGDAALAEGYRRVVLFIGAKGIRALAGDANHIELHDRLEFLLAGRASIEIRAKHYLWYRWSQGLLSISGAATETAEDFEELKAWCENPENRLNLLAAMKKV
jgi:hypothetical protein